MWPRVCIPSFYRMLDLTWARFFFHLNFILSHLFHIFLTTLISCAWILISFLFLIVQVLQPMSKLEYNKLGIWLASIVSTLWLHSRSLTTLEYSSNLKLLIISLLMELVAYIIHPKYFSEIYMLTTSLHNHNLTFFLAEPRIHKVVFLCYRMRIQIWSCNSLYSLHKQILSAKGMIFILT